VPVEVHIPGKIYVKSAISIEWVGITMKRNIILVLWLLLMLGGVALAQPDINTVLMESTFMIQGIAKQDSKKLSIGTVFFVGKPSKDGRQSYYVLVTARHVLDDIAGDDATIFLREPIRDKSFRRFRHTFKIRENGAALYKTHPTADVAVMYFRMPIGDPFALIGQELLVSDERVAELELHPGDELICLGYPNGVTANDLGFPILRSGHIASYPLLPTKTIKVFLFDFMVFPGNSGGPVYFSYDVRRIGNVVKTGGMIGILGLVSEQLFSSVPGVADEPLKLGVVVPATLIKEAIDLLPARD